MKTSGHRALWLASLLLFVGFAVLGWPNIWEQVRQISPLRPAPSASTDAFLSTLLGINNGTARIQAAMAKIPTDRRMTFVAPAGNERWDFISYVIRYLIWPRQIGRFEINSPADLNQITPAHDEVTVFCDLDPPPSYTNRIRIGPHLVIGSTATLEQ